MKVMLLNTGSVASFFEHKHLQTEDTAFDTAIMEYLNSETRNELFCP